MKKKSKVQRGLEIFTERFGVWSLVAEHDQIWVYSESDDGKEEITREAVVEELESLGWFKEDDMGWSHYV